MNLMTIVDELGFVFESLRRSPSGGVSLWVKGNYQVELIADGRWVFSKGFNVVAHGYDIEKLKLKLNKV
jgi:hypothetical protein